MPEVLHNPAADIIRQLRLQQPFLKPNVAAQRMLPDLGARHGELGATRGGDDLRDVRVVEQSAPRICEDVLRRAPFVPGVPERSNLVGAPGDPVAAEVGVAVPLDKVELQHPHVLHIVVLLKLNVPAPWIAVAMAVEEDDDGGEVVVIVDYVLQINVAFASLVLRGAKRCFRIIHRVYRMLPAGGSLCE